MSGPSKITVLGGANLDITGTSQNVIKTNDSNPGSIATNAGGVGRNIAENLARLGNSTSMITMVGNDLGKQVIGQSLTDCGIDQQGIIVKQQCSTGTYLAITDNQGNLSLAVSDMEILQHITPQAIKQRQQTIDNCSQIVIEANLPEQTLKWIAHNNTQPLHADAVSQTKSIKLQSILNRLDILKVNLAEAAAILTVDVNQYDGQTLAKKLHAKGVKKVLLSLGAEGVLFYNGDQMIQQSSMACDIKNDNGAGDSLFAGFITAQQLFDGVEHQLTFAMACASTTLQSVKAVNPQLCLNHIKQKFNAHLPSGVWY